MMDQIPAVSDFQLRQNASPIQTALEELSHFPHQQSIGAYPQIGNLSSYSIQTKSARSHPSLFSDSMEPNIARSGFIATTEQTDLSWIEGIQSSDSVDISVPIEDALGSLSHRSASHAVFTPAGTICNSSTTTGTRGGKGSAKKLSKAQRARIAQQRWVSSLSDEQLARKRDNDREAQRNIRRRTKEAIENLETRNRELERRNGELERKVQDLEKNLWAHTELAAYSCTLLSTEDPHILPIVALPTCPVFSGENSWGESSSRIWTQKSIG
jgi:hypothetical protein